MYVEIRLKFLLFLHMRKNAIHKISMSCHDIGRGMASVADVIVELYEGRKINKEAAMRLIHACRKGVHWCDGNEDEATEPFVEAGYRGLCFEKKEDLSSVYDNDIGYSGTYDVFKTYDKTAAHDCLCPECKAKVIGEYKKSE